MIHFSTKPFEAQDRELAWREVLAQHCGPFEMQIGKDFEARMERDYVGDFPCARLIQNSHFMRRSRKELRDMRHDYYYVILQIAGRSRISQGNGDVDMSPGSVLVVDSGLPLSMQYRGKNAHLCVHLPRAELQECAGVLTRLGQRLSTASAQLVGSLMHTAVTHAPAVDRIHQRALQDSLLAVIGAALSSAQHESPQELATASAPYAVVQMIRDHINQNLDSERLSPRAIAHEYGMSVRHLHRLFKESETSFGDLVRRSRLDRCAADLRDAAMRAVTVTAIAHRWGFCDSAHFSRAFKSEFGQTPTEYRFSVQREGMSSAA